MSLRKKLFLAIGTLFFIAFIISYYLENYLTETHLRDAENKLEQNIENLNKKKRRSIENYLVTSLANLQAKNRAILDRVKENPLIQAGIIRTEEKQPEESWLNNATLLLTNKFLDFVEIYNNDKQTIESSIIIDPRMNRFTKKVQDFEHFSLFALYDFQKKKWDGPYAGLPLRVDQIYPDSSQEYNWKHTPKFYVLFAPQSILKFNADLMNRLNLFIIPIEPFLNWDVTPNEKGSIKNFLANLKSAEDEIKKDPDRFTSTSTLWKSFLQKNTKVPDQMHKKFSAAGFKDEVKDYEMSELNKLDQISMVWGYASLFAAGAFGASPFGERAPLGIVQMEPSKENGKSVLINDIFQHKSLKQINDMEMNFPLRNREDSQQKLTIFLSPEEEKIFLGNSITFTDDKSNFRKTITAASDGDLILKQLSLVTNQLTVFISSGQVVSVFNAQGKKDYKQAWQDLPVHQIQNQSAGTITVHDKEYYFLHMAPMQGLDFHFYIFNPKEKEFFLINKLKGTMSQLIQTISYHMRFAAVAALALTLIFLNHLAKRITRPITHLAKVTDQVGKGKLEEIDFPELKKKPTDEVYKLYHAFSDMVKGLKEKEKVRGVLNKVVSNEIAEEILKEKVSLGGEEKTITVLFADIRDFSTITENMNPKEVINMLNQCMTKVSDKIDEHGGVMDKYVGDEVMALFGAPIQKPDSPLQAIKSALAFIVALKKWNEARKNDNKPSIEMGVGIHTGIAVCGNMGAENRLNYTALGANVNLASRLCGDAEPMQILITEDTLKQEHVEPNIQYEKKDPITPKGFTKPVEIYEVKGLKA
jgi:class 3 adenylate cyclase